MHGTNENLLPRHLIECWYRSIKNRNNLFIHFLEDIKKSILCFNIVTIIIF